MSRLSTFEQRYEDTLLQDLAQPRGDVDSEGARDRVTCLEVGYRAWSHAHDCNPYEYNTLDEIRDYIPVIDQAYGERVGP